MWLIIRIVCKRCTLNPSPCCDYRHLPCSRSWGPLTTSWRSCSRPDPKSNYSCCDQLFIMLSEKMFHSTMCRCQTLILQFCTRRKLWQAINPSYDHCFSNKSAKLHQLCFVKIHTHIPGWSLMWPHADGTSMSDVRTHTGPLSNMTVPSISTCDVELTFSWDLRFHDNTHVTEE